VTRRTWFWLVLVVAAAGCGVAIDRAVDSGQEVASVALSVPILIIAGLTLWYTAPRNAQLKVNRLDEANLDDLIFYIYPQPAQPGERQIPRDYLLQLHVAVYNLGDRKGVLSAINIDGLRNDVGETVYLPESPKGISGTQWISRSGFINTHRHFENLNSPGPYILEPDDVIVLRFRSRRGIDWSDRWTPTAVRDFCAPLQRPLVSAFGTMAWRRGGQVVRDSFEVRLQVVQQAEYVQLIETLTEGFTIRPDVPHQAIELE
jgi:hypothetical protein